MYSMNVYILSFVDISIIVFTMNAIFGLVVVCLAVAAQGSPTIHIVGGNTAPVGKFPYQVSLRRYNSHFCGGSIIGKRTILTAAHCLGGLSSSSSLRSLTVHAGTNLLNKSGDVYTVEKAIAHKKFDGYLLIHDIGLLILSSDIEYTELVQPVPLATDDSAPAGHPCILSGWGRTSYGGRVPNELQELELNVYDQTKCGKAHWRVQDTHICTFKQTGQGACHGDSGGPLVADGVQIGIVSFGEPCAVGYPDVFTRVAAYQDWILEHIVDDE